MGADASGLTASLQDSMTDMDTESPAWSYEGATGPEYWSSLSGSFTKCDDGLRQSPIDITGYRNSIGGHIEFMYDSMPIAVINNGRTISAWYEQGSSIVINGRTFHLTTAHYHAPSEHLIDGTRFSAEIHYVHEDNEGNLAVVAVLFELGQSSMVIEGFLASAGRTQAPYEAHHPSLHSRFLKPKNGGHYCYVGSTTTPPCIEPVEWFVMAEKATVSEDQVIALQSVTHGPNNRAVQPLNGRTIRRVN